MTQTTRPIVTRDRSHYLSLTISCPQSLDMLIEQTISMQSLDCSQAPHIDQSRPSLDWHMRVLEGDFPRSAQTQLSPGQGNTTGAALEFCSCRYFGRAVAPSCPCSYICASCHQLPFCHPPLVEPSCRTVQPRTLGFSPMSPLRLFVSFICSVSGATSHSLSVISYVSGSR